MPSITITIDAGSHGPEADSLWQSVRATVDALERLDKAMASTNRPNNKWVIERIKMSSPLTLTLAGIKAFDDAKSVDPVGPFLRGIRQVDEEGTRPDYFDDAIMADIKSVASLVSNGTHAIKFKADDEEEVSPSEKTVATIRQLGRIGRDYETLTELDGTLEAINVHGAPEFFVYDRLNDNAVRCFFDAKDAEAVGRLITRRVRVSGHVKFTANHEPKSMRVTSFDALPDRESATPLSEIHKRKMRVTGGRDSVDYIRGMRDAK